MPMYTAETLGVERQVRGYDVVDFLGGVTLQCSGEVVIDLNLHDILETTERALRVAGNNFDSPLVTVAGSPSTLERLVAANTGTRLIVATDLVPSEVGDLEAWQLDQATRSLAVGCHGVIRTAVTRQVLEQFPGATLLSRPFTNPAIGLPGHAPMSRVQ